MALMLESQFSKWNNLSRGQRRTVLALLIILDANMGLLKGWGLLNLVDSLVGGNIPNDMVRLRGDHNRLHRRGAAGYGQQLW